MGYEYTFSQLKENFVPTCSNDLLFGMPFTPTRTCMRLPGLVKNSREVTPYFVDYFFLIPPREKRGDLLGHSETGGAP